MESRQGVWGHVRGGVARPALANLTSTTYGVPVLAWVMMTIGLMGLGARGPRGAP